MRWFDWIFLLFTTLITKALRLWQREIGFEAETGLAVFDCLPAQLLPLALLVAAIYFFSRAHFIPLDKVDTRPIGESFPFGNAFICCLVVIGAFTLFTATVLFIIADFRAVNLMFSLTAALSALIALFTVFALRRGNSIGIVSLIPIAAHVLLLIFSYREHASNPVLQMYYPEILALGVLLIAQLLFTAFVFGCGKPQSYAPTAALSIVLAVCAAEQTTASICFYSGFACIQAAFLMTSNFYRIPEETEDLHS